MDQLFSAKLNEQTFEVPEAFIADLNSKLDALAPAQKKGSTWFWTSFIVLFFVGGTLIYFFMSEEISHINQMHLSQKSEPDSIESLSFFEKTSLPIANPTNSNNSADIDAIPKNLSSPTYSDTIVQNTHTINVILNNNNSNVAQVIQNTDKKKKVKKATSPQVNYNVSANKNEGSTASSSISTKKM